MKNRPYIGSIILLVTVFLTMCRQNPILTEYDGINLIANKGFDTDWTIDTTDDYMLFEEVTDAGQLAALGLPEGVSGESVYRLEIKNVVPDGDFETAAVGSLPSADWALSGSAVGEVSSALPASGANSLLFDLTLPEDVVSFDFSALTDSYPDNAGYLVRFDIITNTPTIFRFYFPSTLDIDLRTADIDDAAVVIDFPDDFVETTSTFTKTGGADLFSITGTAQTGYIDNLRLVRTDESLLLRLSLPWFDPDRPTGPNGEALNLVSGWYQFRVWVKTDPTADTGINRYASDAISLGTNSSYSIRTDGEVTFDPSAWIQVGEVFFYQIDAPADPQDPTPVIELTISPTDILNSNSLDVGSLCLTSPTLHFYSSDPR